MITDPANPLARGGVGPNDGAAPVLVRAEEALADERVEIERQAVLDSGSPAAPSAVVAAHDFRPAPLRFSEIPWRTPL